jgi:hypothetical protein
MKASQMASRIEPVPASQRPPGAVLELRYNRRRAIGAVVVGAVVYVAGICAGLWTVDPAELGRSATLVSYLVFLVGLNVLINGGLALRRRVCFRYDTVSGTVTGRDWWGRQRVYPGRASESLEYSIHDAALYRVREDGRRRRLIRKSFWLDRRDWIAFVDAFVARQRSMAGTDDVGPELAAVRDPARPGRSDASADHQGGLADRSAE